MGLMKRAGGLGREKVAFGSSPKAGQVKLYVGLEPKEVKKVEEARKVIRSKKEEKKSTGRVKQHQRKTKGGKLVVVKEHGTGKAIKSKKQKKKVDKVLNVTLGQYKEQKKKVDLLMSKIKNTKTSLPAKRLLKKKYLAEKKKLGIMTTREYMQSKAAKQPPKAPTKTSKKVTAKKPIKVKEVTGFAYLGSGRRITSGDVERLLQPGTILYNQKIKKNETWSQTLARPNFKAVQVLETEGGKVKFSMYKTGKKGNKLIPKTYQMPKAKFTNLLGVS